MSDHGIKRNASGYYDETPYKAITKGPEPGEIYTHRTLDDYVLILARDERVCAMLKLDNKFREGKICVRARAQMYTDPLKLDNKFREGKICVRARAQMYTDPLKLSYCFHDQLGAYVKTLPEKEFAFVRQTVAKTLGLAKEAGTA